MAYSSITYCLMARVEGFFSTVLGCPFALLGKDAVAGLGFFVFALPSSFLASGAFFVASRVARPLPSLDLDPF